MRIWQCGLLLTCVVVIGCGREVEQSVTQQLCDQEGTEGCCPGSPIIVDMAGDGIALTSAEDGVVFELRPGRFGQWAWTEKGSDDAFLVIDSDDSGRIQDGSELFGDGSPQVANGKPNGFNALAYYDWLEMGGNGDGVIDAQDKVWSRLRLWNDADHDAYSATYELTPLDDAGVHSFSLVVAAASHFDQHGNETRFTSTIVADAPISQTIVDVWLTQAPLPTDDDATGLRATEYTCTAWGYALQHAFPTMPWEPFYVPCERALVQSDPFATDGLGWLTKLVIRRSIGTEAKSTHISRARSQVRIAVGYDQFNPTSGCFTSIGSIYAPSPFPSPDLYPPPYDYETPPESVEMFRVKCTSRYVDGGGGGGCAFTAEEGAE